MAQPYHAFAIDITRHIGDSGALVHSARLYTTRFGRTETTWYTRSEQVKYLNEDEKYRICDNPTHVPDLIRAWIAEPRKLQMAILHVLSYDAAVLGAAASQNDSSLVVVTLHCSELGKLSPSGIVESSPGMSRHPSSLSLDEALELAQIVLREGGYTAEDRALHQPQLRVQMSMRDPRARKSSLDRSSTTLITRVVEKGLSEGWLKRVRRAGQTGTEHIWLTEPSAATTDVRANSKPTGAQPEMLEFSDAMRGNDERGALGLVPGPGRAAIMESHLRRRRIGSRGETRAYLFEALEELLRNSRPIRIAELMFRTEEEAVQKASINGYGGEKNWHAVVACFFHMVLAAKVLKRSDGTPIDDGLGAYSSVVDQAATDIRDRCEAYLVEQIVRDMGDVTLDDEFNLGLTLYQRGGDNPAPRAELLARADELLVVLSREGRIRVDPNGHIIAAPPDLDLSNKPASA